MLSVVGLSVGVAAAATGQETAPSRAGGAKEFLAWMERSSELAREEARGCAPFEAAAARLRRRQLDKDGMPRPGFDSAQALRVLELAPMRNAGRADLFTALAQELPDGLDATRVTVAIQRARGCDWRDGALLLQAAIRQVAAGNRALQGKIRDAALEQVWVWTSEPDGLKLQAHAGDVLHALVDSGLVPADSRWLAGLAGSRGGIRRMMERSRILAARGAESPRAWLDAAAAEARGARDYRLRLAALCVSVMKSVDVEPKASGTVEPKASGAVEPKASGAVDPKARAHTERGAR